MGILVILFVSIVFFAIDCTRRVQNRADGWDIIMMVCVGCSLFVGLLFQILIIGKSLQ